MRDNEDGCQFSVAELAHSMLQAWGKALGYAPEAYIKTGDVICLTAVPVAVAILEDGQGMSFAEIAGQVRMALGLQDLDVSFIETPRDALCWEAAIRHLASLYFAEDEINVEELERFWNKWVDDCLQQQKVGAA